MLRTDLYLEEKQKREIQELARREKQSFSGMVRIVLDEGVRIRKQILLEKAAGIMAREYSQDSELTAFTALDGEDFLEKR